MALTREVMAQAGHVELAAAMARIEEYVEKWWAQNYLPWFTDHGPAHSRRVAEYADRIGCPPDLSETIQLSALERFILWASAWLHDLGMQVLVDQPLGSLDAAAYDKIRHQHPAQSCIEILGHAAEIGLPALDAPLISLIAYIAQAHGTSYYAETVGLLRSYTTSTRVRGENVRGPLLASILLLADELDLHYERAVNLSGRATLNSVSNAHAFKHRCVNSCDVIHDAGEVRMHVVMQRLDGISDEIIVSVERWIADKLRRQIALVETDFVAGFRGHIRLDRRIGFEVRVLPFHADAPSNESLSVINADLARDELINHDAAFRELRTAIEDRALALVTGRSESIFGDDDGREDLLQAAEGWARTLPKAQVIRCGTVFESAAASSVIDVIERIVQSVQGPGTGSFGLDMDRDKLLDMAIEAIGDTDARLIVFVSSVDKLPDGEARWLLSTALPNLQSAGDVSIVISAAPELEIDDSTSPIVLVSTEELDRSAVGAYMARFEPWSHAMPHAHSRFDYAQYKELASSQLAYQAGVDLRALGG